MSKSEKSKQKQLEKAIKENQRPKRKSRSFYLQETLLEALDAKLKKENGGSASRAVEAMIKNYLGG